jgi:hypothetical protein
MQSRDHSLHLKVPTSHKGGQRSRKTSKKTLNKGSKKGKTLMRHGGKKKKSLKKTQIGRGTRGRRESKLKQQLAAEVAPPTREQLLEKRLALIEERRQQEAALAARGEDDFISQRIRYIQREINEINFQLKTPAEQEAILADRHAAAVASAIKKKEEKESEKERLQKYEQEKMAQKLKQKLLDRAKMQAVRSEEEQRVNAWEQEHLEQLQDKSFVRSQLDELQARHVNLTAEGQPKGATLGYGIWHDLMVELLRRYGA